MAASNKYRKQLLTSDKARQLHDNREKMEEEVRRLTEKVQILQAEVYSRQTEKARIEFNAARVQLKERKMQTVKMNPRDLNLKIKQELETYMEGTEQSINAFEQHLNTVKQQSLTIHVVNGKHALRIRVDPLATFGHLLDEVRLFWNVPDERVFVLRDEHGNYWSPLSNVIQQFSALRHTPKLYFLSKEFPDKKILQDFDPDALLKTAAERFNRNAMVRNQGRARFLLVDALKVVFFITIFTMVLVLDHKVLMSHRFVLAIKRNFIEKRKVINRNALEKQFHDINDINGMLEYLKTDLHAALFKQRILRATQNTTSGIYDNDFFVYGGIRFRQQRVYLDSCSLIKATGISTIIPACYADYSEGSKYPGPEKLSGDSWGKPSCITGGNNTLFNLDTYLDEKRPVPDDANEAARFPKVTGLAGEYHYYPGEGFYESIPLDEEIYKATIDKIIDCRWIDERTRLVVAEINFYNPNTDQFAALKIMFEMLATGVVHPSIKLHANRVTMYTRDDDLPVFVLHCCVLLFCMFRFIAWRSEITALVGQYGTWTKFLNIFTYLDISVVFIVLYTSSIRASLYWRYEPYFLLREIATESYYEIYGILSLFHQVMVLESIAVLFTFFTILKYLDVVSEGMLIMETFNIAFPSVLSYMVVFISVLFGFVALYHNIYGPSMEIFSDFSSSLRALLLTLIGDVQYLDAFFLPWETSALHDLIFLVFLVLMYFVMTSLFLAIINEAHIQAQKHYKENKEKMQFINYNMAFEILCSWALPLQERITRARAEEAEQEKAKVAMQSQVIDRGLIH